MSSKKQRVLFLHYTAPSILGGVEHVMGIHARAARDAGDNVTIVAGRGTAPGVKLLRIPELDTQFPAVLRDRAALARGEVTPQHALLVATIERKLRRRQLTDDGNVEINWRDLRDRDPRPVARIDRAYALETR